MSISTDRAHRRGRAAGDLRGRDVQRPRAPAQPGRGSLLRHRRAAQAPARPDPQPGRDGQGLRRPRAPGVRERDRRAQHRDRRAGPGGAGPGREPAHRRAAPVVRGRRGLPGPEGEPELPRAAERAHRHRGQDPGLAPLLQHDRARPEHEDRAVPVERHRALRERRASASSSSWRTRPSARCPPCRSGPRPA